MTDDNNARLELSRRKVLGGMATVGVAGAGAGAGTWAYWSDEGTSENNVVEAGTLSLDDPENAQITADNLAPTQSTDGTISVSESSTISTDGMDIDTSVYEGEDGGFSSALNVTNLQYDGSDISGQLSGSTLADLEGTTLEVDSPGDGKNFDIELTMDEEADDAYQGASADITFTFTLYQNASEQRSS